MITLQCIATRGGPIRDKPDGVGINRAERQLLEKTREIAVGGAGLESAVLQGSASSGRNVPWVVFQ